MPRQYTSHQFESEKLREGLSDLGSACKSFKNTRKTTKTASDLSIEKGYDYLRLLAVFNYFNGLLSNLGKVEASKAAAFTMMPFVKGGSEDYLSRNIRAWEAYFYDNGCLLVSQQGKHRKFIEMYWGYVKRLVRKECDYNFNSLLTTVPTCLDAVPIAFIRRAARKSFRYIDAYRLGLSPKQVEFAVKKYTSHRTLPPSYLDEIQF